MPARTKQVSKGRKASVRGEDKAGRTHDPEQTKQDILAVARQEFAREGLAGARIDEIAAKTKTSKRMIYYYFLSKEGLYEAVLEAEYRRIREQESTLELNRLPPLDALRKLVGFTFDFTERNELFVRLVMIENIHNGAFLEGLTVVQQLSAAVLENVRKLYDRGVAEGVFRNGIDPLELHWHVSALCFFNVSNRPTFSKLFDIDTAASEAHARRRQTVLDAIERFVTC